MSGGIGQLLKGIVMGVVLILAIIGTMSMLDKNKSNNDQLSTATKLPSSSNKNAQSSNQKDIAAPEINISQPTSSSTQAFEDNVSESITTKPQLENERNVQPEEPIKPKFGILKLSTVNSEDNSSLLSDYEIFDDNNKKVATSNNSSSGSYRLAAGTYKVITTLSESNGTTRPNIEPVQSISNIIVSANKLTEEVIKLTPPPTIGVLQVSAVNAKNKQAMRANFIIQKENGETIASRQNITNSLFKLKAGSYKVTVKNGNNSDFRTVVVDPGESVIEVFNLQESFLQGKVLVKVFDTHTNNAIPADIEISSSNGNVIQSLKSVSQTELALTAGKYKIKVTGQKGESSKNILVSAGQTNTETFRIDANTVNNNDTVKINDNVNITGVDNNSATNPEEVDASNNEQINNNDSALGKLRLFARKSTDQKPLKSNFYVQTLNGVNVAKKIYADNAEFDLKPGQYKITIRSKDHKNIVKNINVVAKQASSETFSLVSTLSQTVKPKLQVNSSNRAVSSQQPKIPAKIVQTGLLNIKMQPPKNTHFIISTRAGKKIVELTSVPSANFKLDTGIYVVTAILNGQRRKQTIQINQDKTSRLNFNANNFQQRNTNTSSNIRGTLRSRIVDSSGRPLKGNLSVMNLSGQVVAQANNVTFGEFVLPPVPHIIQVNYQGLSGSERVQITANKTTVQTFTIARSNTNNPATAKPSRDANDILREKLKEELRRIF